MEQYISKSALLAEITHKIKVLEAFIKNFDVISDKVEKAKNKIEVLCDVLLFIDTIEVKELQVKESAEIERDKETCKENSNSLTQEPASDELEKAAVEAFKQIVDSDKNNFLEIFKAGAKWQAEQFEKNRLAACDRQAEEEAEIERDFVMGIIENEHRQPTFDDAIKYGMRLQKEQMMTKSIEAVVSQVPCSNEIIFYNPSSVYEYCLPQEMNKLGLYKGDKVKLIIIKED